jgi:hypothetical protein
MPRLPLLFAAAPLASLLTIGGFHTDSPTGNGHGPVLGRSIAAPAVRPVGSLVTSPRTTYDRVLAELAQPTPAIDWRLLAGLDYQSGKTTDTLKKLNGKRVRIPGFVVPLDDFMEDGAEFLLVPYYGACVHTPPPPPNQIIFVQMAGKKAVKLSLFDAVWMHGTLKIASVESPYGTVGFTLEGLRMEPYSAQ